jgi:hypothetical protein
VEAFDEDAFDVGGLRGSEMMLGQWSKLAMAS